jgi:hypothetical protein
MRESISARDTGVRRLRRATSVTLAAAGALVAAFAGLAARAVPGHHTVKTTPPRTTTKTANPTPTPPPLIAVQSAATPAPPASTPAPAQSPPVVVSGGS